MKKYYACFKFEENQPSMIQQKANFGKIRNKLWGHCFIIVPTGKEVCMIVDKTIMGVKISIFTCFAYDLALQLEATGHEILEVPVKRVDNPIPEFFSCTGFMKKVFNIKEPWIITPRQLRRRLDGFTKLSRTRS